MSEKKVAVVVGVGAGLGAALARRFASGYSVALVARKADYLQGLAEEIKAAGGDPVGHSRRRGARRRDSRGLRARPA